MVSVIVPAYRTTRFIAQSLESVFAQTFQNFEVIVVNDGCPDTERLEAVLAPYTETGRIRYEARPHRGPAATRNHGIAVARGEFVAMLDSDDLWEPRYLEVLLNHLQSNPDVDIVYPNAIFFGNPDMEGRLYTDLHPWSGEPTFAAILRRECCVFGLVTARRAAILRVGGYDEHLGSCEDYELWLRSVKLGCRIGYSNEVLVRYRQRATSLSRDVYKLALDTASVFDRLEAMDLTPEEREAVHKERAVVNATCDLWEGKYALQAGDFDVALTKLESAHRVVRNFKIRITMLFLRWAPNVLRTGLMFRSGLTQAGLSRD